MTNLVGTGIEMTEIVMDWSPSMRSAQREYEYDYGAVDSADLSLNHSHSRSHSHSHSHSLAVNASQSDDASSSSSSSASAPAPRVAPAQEQAQARKEDAAGEIEGASRSGARSMPAPGINSGIGAEPAPLQLQLGEQKFEIAELCGMFLGNGARRMYVASISVYFYGTLWAYSTVFAHSWSNLLPLSGLQQAESYFVYLAWWGVIQCSWCLFELDEQVLVQVLMAIGRVLMVLVMILTVVVCDATGNDSFNLPSDAPGHKTYGGSFRLWDMSNLYIILPIGFYANVMHHSVPTLVKPLLDKTQAGSIFATAFCISFVCYLVLALTVGSYFGKYANPSSNLNWMEYKGFNPSEQLLGSSYVAAAAHPSGVHSHGSAEVKVDVATAELAPLYARLFTLFVVIFPSLDVASAYPLNAITLGNNLMATYYGPTAMPAAERSWSKRSFWRLLAAAPPVIAAGCVRDLGPITAYTGLTGIIIALVTPSALAHASEAALKSLNIPHNTAFSLPGTGGAFSLAVIAIGVFSILFILSSLLSNGVPQVLG